MIEKEYALALYESCEDFEETKFELENFLIVYHELKPIMESPMIKINEKKKLLQKTLVGFSDLFLHFLFVLLDNKRINLIEEIEKAFSKLCFEKKNIAIVDVHVSKALSKEEKEKILSFLKIKLQCDVEIKEIKDLGYLGGIKIIYNGNCIDYSTSDRMNKMHAWL